MPTRLLIAYLLIALLIAGGAGAIWWKIHHAGHRVLARRRIRERTAAAARLAATRPKDGHG